jgi:hypothetical protein
MKPMLVVITSAPWAVAYRVAAARSPTMLPSSSPTRIGMIVASGATPVTPTPSSAAATVPATCVPWPWWSSTYWKPEHGTGTPSGHTQDSHR